MPLNARFRCLGAIALLSACNPGRQNSAVATVNGVAITEAEVLLGLKPTAHGAGEPSVPDRRKAVIAALIHDELVRQKSVELGLEPEGPAADEVARLELLLGAARRRALAEAFYRTQIAKKAEPSASQVRAFFENNAALIRTEVHLRQILLRDEAQILTVQRALQGGASFESEARRQFTGLPEGAGAPWELGFLSWKQLPEQWRGVVASLAPGQVSPIIRGPGGRFWILELIERREKNAVTFEDARPQIIEDLTRARIEQLTLQADVDLRKGAQISEP